MSRVNTPLLDEAARAALESLYKQHPNHTLRQRCQLVLLKATGRTSHDVGQVVGLCHVSVNSWLKRYRKEGLTGWKTSPDAAVNPCSRSPLTKPACGPPWPPIASALPWPRPSGKASGWRGNRPWDAMPSALF
ncbi:helix-turn-helix domain-containing protein [Hymenobacter nivis]|uniref:Uncharacterized protein n=1 Tax=Hymenobacter nivis TaxID=1850093 RepID=A0A2Z3GEB4_9BACT|nr:hypothetical protein DDQ68_03885 [Hymenobacter nivis]